MGIPQTAEQQIVVAVHYEYGYQDKLKIAFILFGQRMMHSP
jgi:hypothetical protein